MPTRKPTDDDIVFKIDVLTPETLPMARLAEYLTGLAALLGERDRVHFVKLAKGSTKICQRVERQSLPMVRARLESVRALKGPDDAMRGFREIDELLRADNAVGAMTIGGSKILQFPGRKLSPEGSVGPIVQHDYVDGQLIRIGGKDHTVPVHLREADGTIHYCTADVDRARKLAPYLYGVELRVSGKGHWCREPDGTWRMQFFRIEDFEPLNETPLTDVAKALHEITPSDWPNDILEELRSERNG